MTVFYSDKLINNRTEQEGNTLVHWILELEKRPTKMAGMWLVIANGSRSRDRHVASYITKEEHETLLENEICLEILGD